MTQKKIVIVGGGYAGLMAGVRLAGKTRHQPVEITLINPSENFVERPKLHQVATGQMPPTYPIADFLRGTGIKFKQGKATIIDPKLRTVTVDGGGELAYDYLIYAVGSRVDRARIPGVSDHAYTLDATGSRNAIDLFNRLRIQNSGQVVVVGSGPTGIEVATEIADCYPHLDVHVVSDGKFGPFTDDKVRAYMQHSLKRRDIQIIEHTPVTTFQEDHLIVQDGAAIPFDICVWAGGFRALPLARDCGLSVNEIGQIRTDPYLRSVSHPEIFAVGDAVDPLHDTGAPMRMSLVSAAITGAYVADTLVGLLKGNELRVFGFSTYGQGIALGTRDAVGFGTYPNDQRSGPILTGRFGLWMRNFFVNLLRQIIHFERRIPGVFFWRGSGRGKVTPQVMRTDKTAEGTL